MGVTVALAWRLPDQPDFREKSEMNENRKKIKLNRKNYNQTDDHHSVYDVHDDRKHYHDHRIKVVYRNHSNDEQEQSGDWSNAKWGTVIDRKKSEFRHRIYPVLLKRRAISMAGTLTRDAGHSHLHVQHHRRTRFSLYQSIEKYLSA